MRSSTLALAGYLVVVVWFVSCELVALRWPRRVEPLGLLTSRVMTTRWRYAVMVGWMWLGWHLFVRS